mgnify:CR=1 FL=1
MLRIIMTCIRCYQYVISPFMANHCRYHPSCSNYALQAVEIHGTLKGSYLVIRRLLRCHPFHPGGYDPVPDNHIEQQERTTN